MRSIDLLSADVVADLRTMLERIERAATGEVRAVATDNGLSLFACTIHPTGLTDEAPLVLVHRGFARAADHGDDFDVVVESRALLDRIPRLTEHPFTLQMPTTELTAVWAGVLPPRSGWDAAGAIDVASLRRVAREGADRVSTLLPEHPGQALVERVRREVWSLEMLPGIPAAAAFALDTLGFMHGEELVRVHRSRSWTRLSTPLGDVLVRSAPRM